MKLISAIWMIALAVIISAIAAFFSIDGLAALFSATATGVMVMAGALEVGKVTVATYLHARWKSRGDRFIKIYMIVAMVSLMAISSLGIFGYLAKGHLESSAPLAPIELQIAQKTNEIDQLKDQVKANNTRLVQLDTAVNSIIGTDASKGLRARRSQTAERAEIKASIDAANTQMNKLSSEIVPLKVQTAGVEAKLGPIKFVDPKNPEKAVRIVIYLIMLSFDPLALALIVTGAGLLNEALGERGKKKRPEEDEIVEQGSLDHRHYGPVTAEFTHASIFPHFEINAPMPEPSAAVEDVTEVEETPAEIVEEIVAEEAPTTSLLLELEEAVPKIEVEEPKVFVDDKDMLLSILERKPELLEFMIEAVRDADKAETKKKDGDSWIDDNWVPPPAK